MTFTFFFLLEKEEKNPTRQKLIFCACAHSLVNVQKASPSNPPPALNPTSPAVICVFNYTVAAAGTRRVFSLDIKVLRVAISCLNTWWHTVGLSPVCVIYRLLESHPASSYSFCISAKHFSLIQTQSKHLCPRPIKFSWIV